MDMVCCWGACAQVPGGFAGIDSKGRLVEVGWLKVPTLMHLAWQVRRLRRSGGVLLERCASSLEPLPVFLWGRRRSTRFT